MRTQIYQCRHFFQSQNTCRCVLSWFIFHMLYLCAGLTHCIFSPLNFLFHVVKTVFIMHQWTSLKGKFSLHLEQDRKTGVCSTSLDQMTTNIFLLFLQYSYIFVSWWSLYSMKIDQNAHTFLARLVGDWASCHAVMAYCSLCLLTSQLCVGRPSIYTSLLFILTIKQSIC